MSMTFCLMLCWAGEGERVCSILKVSCFWKPPWTEWVCPFEAHACGTAELAMMASAEAMVSVSFILEVAR